MIVELQRPGHVQRLTYDDFEARVREGAVSPETPVRFEVVTGDRFVPAGELELYRSLAAPGERAFREGLTKPGIALATAILVGVQLRIFWLAQDGEARGWMQAHLANSGPALFEQGEVWRLLTYGVLHFEPAHLLFNMCFLAYAGYHLERALGWRNLLALYFGSVVAGGLLSVLMSPDRQSIGASGGDFGLLGAAVLFGWKHWAAIPARARQYFGWALFPYILTSLLSGAQASNVDNWCHTGGLLGGALLTALLDPEVLPGRARKNRLVRLGLGAVIGAALLGLATGGLRLLPLADHEGTGWRFKAPTTWTEGWAFTGDRGWFSPTGLASLSAATTEHKAPLTLDLAVAALTDRLLTGGPEAEVVADEPILLDGTPARRIRARLSQNGERQAITAWVVVRGVYEQRLVFQSTEASSARYTVLEDEIAAAIELVEPAALQAALQDARTWPTALEPSIALAEALSRYGQPEAALRELDRARALSPTDPRPWVSRLSITQVHGLPGAATLAREALAAAPDDTHLLTVAAEALKTDGAEAEARALLDEAWAQHPGDRRLKRIRLRWGMPVTP